MTAERHESESMHEFRLEGIGLLVGGGFLLALVVGAFFLGRWVEHRAHPAGLLPAVGGGPLSQVQPAGPQPDADVAQGLTHFDDLAGSQKELEPGREIDRGVTPAVDPAPARPEPSAARPAARVESGNFFVQVGALRDQTAAADLIKNLEGQGYGVRLFSEREGQGMLYKVRVGGYPSESRARDIAAKLRESGYAGAWVASVE